MTTSVFFYGLYMDTSLLESMGLRPRQIGAARLDGFQLRIGERATLVPAPGRSAYGFMIDLSEGEVAELYSRPEVRGYIPESVTVVLLDDSSEHRAVCYVLQSEEPNSGADAQYAASLAALVARLGLPTAYAREVARLGDGRSGANGWHRGIPDQ
jgi:hypothetical protein